jgi:hypothetical protein
LSDGRQDFPAVPEQDADVLEVLFGLGRLSPLRRTVRVDFARRDLSGKIACPAGPEALTEGFDTRDLKEAKALLDELS